MRRIRACQDAPHATRSMTVTIFSWNETSLMWPEPNYQGRTSPFELIPWTGGEENGDEHKNGVGLGSASGVCDRVYDRLQFLYRVDRYLARLCGLLTDPENHGPRKYNPGAFLFDPNDKPREIGKTRRRKTCLVMYIPREFAWRG